MNGKDEQTRQVGLTQSDTFLALENLQEIQRLPSIHPLNLNYFGAEQCEPGYSFGPFIRTSYLIHFVRSGRGCLIKEEKRFEIGPEQAFLICPGEETIYKADDEDPWQYMWIGFHGLEAEGIVKKAGFSKDRPVLDIRNMPQITDTMKDLLSCRSLSYVDELKRMGYLYQLIALLMQSGGQDNTADSGTEDQEKLYVRMAVNLLINSSDPQIRVSDVARAIGISRGYLTTLFKREMKVTPQEFQLNFRMERAGDLLRSTDSPVGQIAEELGYMDVLSFSKSFRRHYGISPTRFREQTVQYVTKEEKGSFSSDHPL